MLFLHISHFPCLLPLRLITDSIDGLKGHSLGSMEHFLLFQMLAAKLLEKALPFLAPRAAFVFFDDVRA